MEATLSLTRLPVPDAATAFEIQLTYFREKYSALWNATPTEFPETEFPETEFPETEFPETEFPETGAPPTEAVVRSRQQHTERSTDRIVDEVEAELRAMPRSPAAQNATRRRIRRVARRYVRTSLGLPAAEADVIFSDAYFDVTARFARRARDFDAGVEIEDLFQALRNLWIMNLFQLFLERGISLSPAMVGYSLLYPYTDNPLDDPATSPSDKRCFCERLERRLAGLPVAAATAKECQVFELVGMVETQYARGAYPGVYQSLLAIHRAQLASLRQQSAAARSTAELLELSIAKGGASVLADGYLVAGDLAPDEADFFFGYGIVLQLIDDLQDIETDLAAGHSTLFTQQAAAGNLDELTGRLAGFLDTVLDGSTRFRAPRFDVLRSLVRRNCGQLIVQAVAQNPRFFSKGFSRRLERRSPVRFAYARKKRREVLRRYGKLNRHLRRDGRAGSLFEALAR